MTAQWSRLIPDLSTIRAFAPAAMSVRTISAYPNVTASANAFSDGLAPRESKSFRISKSPVIEACTSGALRTRKAPRLSSKGPDHNPATEAILHSISAARLNRARTMLFRLVELRPMQDPSIGMLRLQWKPADSRRAIAARRVSPHRARHSTLPAYRSESHALLSPWP